MLQVGQESASVHQTIDQRTDTENEAPHRVRKMWRHYLGSLLGTSSSMIKAKRVELWKDNSSGQS